MSDLAGAGALATGVGAVVVTGVASELTTGAGAVAGVVTSLDSDLLMVVSRCVFATRASSLRDDFENICEVELQPTTVTTAAVATVETIIFAAFMMGS